MVHSNPQMETTSYRRHSGLSRTTSAPMPSSRDDASPPRGLSASRVSDPVAPVGLATRPARQNKRRSVSDPHGQASDEQHGDEDGQNGYSLYKTELCRSWAETGTCRYGLKCQFAHGREELRDVQRHPKYKTEICRSFWSVGTCPYGTRCRFIHKRNPNDGAQASDYAEPSAVTAPVTPPAAAPVAAAPASAPVAIPRSQPVDIQPRRSSVGAHSGPSYFDTTSPNGSPPTHGLLSSSTASTHSTVSYNTETNNTTFSPGSSPEKPTSRQKRLAFFSELTTDEVVIPSHDA